MITDIIARNPTAATAAPATVPVEIFGLELDTLELLTLSIVE